MAYRISNISMALLLLVIILNPLLINVTKSVSEEYTQLFAREYVGFLQPGSVYEVVGDEYGWHILKTGNFSGAFGYKVVATLENVTLEPGDVIFPHLYDWQLDGVDDYIQAPPNEFLIPKYELTVGALVNLTDPSKDQKIVAVAYPSQGGYVLGVKGFKLYPEFWDSQGTRFAFEEGGPIEANKLEYLAATWKTGGQLIGYLNGEQVAAIPVSNYPIGVVNAPFTIGVESWGSPPVFFVGGRISFIYIFNRSLSQDEIKEIYETKVLPTKDLVAFFDPTCFDDTGYLNILPFPKIRAVPFNGAERVFAHTKWIWLLKNMTSDDKLHFMWFWNGMLIRIKDSSNNTITEFNITGDVANSHNQVRDYAINLTQPLENVTVEALSMTTVVRVKAPTGALVRIVGSTGLVYGEAVVGDEGYVEFRFEGLVPDATIVVLGKYASTPDVLVKPINEDTVLVKTSVADTPLPNILVRLINPANESVIDYGLTNATGEVVLQTKGISTFILEVSGIVDGIYYTALMKTTIIARTTVTETQTKTITETETQTITYTTTETKTTTLTETKTQTVTETTTETTTETVTLGGVPLTYVAAMAVVFLALLILVAYFVGKPKR